MIGPLFWSFMEQGGSKLAQLIVQLVLARILAPEAFGVVAILLVFTQIADSIAQSGMGTALIQREGADSLEYSTALWLSLALAFLLYVAMFFLAPTIALFYDMDDLVSPLRVISLSFVFNAFNSIQRSYLQKHMDFRTLCKANVCSIVASGVLGITSALIGWGVWALVVQYVSQAAFACWSLFLLASWKPTLNFDIQVARELYSYGWKICVTGVLNTIYTSVSELILGKTCSKTDLGFYSQGRKWPNAGIQLFSNALQNVFLPRFASLQSDVEALRDSMSKMLKEGSYLVIPVACFTSVASRALVSILLGDAWMECTPVFSLACLGNVVLILQLVNLRAYMALGRSDTYLVLQTVKVLVSGIAIATTAIITGNIVCVAVANFVATIVNVVVIDLCPASRTHGYSRIAQLIDIAPIVLVALLAMTGAASVLFFDLSAVTTLVMQALIYGIIYLGLSRALKLEELEIVHAMLREAIIKIK